jgi:MFS family permease
VLLVVLLSIAIHSVYIGSKVLVSLFALELGADQVTVGIIAALYGVMPMLLGVYSGRMVDTVGNRVPLLLGAACVGCAMMAGYVFHNLAVLFVTTALVGAGFMFFNVPIQDLTGSHGTAEHRARNFSLLSIGYSASAFIGPVFAGYSIQYAGYALTFLFFSLFTLVPITLLLVFRKFGRATGPRVEHPQRKAIDLLRNPPLRRLIITSGLIVSASDLFAFYVPIYAHSAGLTPANVGHVLGTYAVAALVTRFAFPAIMRRWRNEQVLFAAMLTAAAAFVAFPLMPTLVALMAAAFVIGLGLGCGQPLSMMMSYERAPKGRTGEVTGLRLVANNTARIVVPIVAGTFGTLLGTSAVFWLNAVNLTAIGFMSRR